MSVSNNKKSFDIVFLSYQEESCESNWEHLKVLAPLAKRVHGVSGILKAHKEAALVSETDFFFLVDGDNYVYRDFSFQPPFEDLDDGSIYVWRAKNPVNDLVYGYGGVKLYPKKLLLSEGLEAGTVKGDLATNLTKKYVVVEELASETRFNGSPLEAWRGAFRECVKLQLNVLNKRGHLQSSERLHIWTSKANQVPFREEVLRGARDGKSFANLIFRGNEEIKKINDFNWLNQKFSDSEKLSDRELELCFRLLIGLGTIYPDSELIGCLKGMLRALDEGDDSSFIETFFYVVSLLGDYPLLNPVRDLFEAPLSVHNQLTYASVVSKESKFWGLLELKNSLDKAEHSNVALLISQGIQVVESFPETVRVPLSLLIKEKFSYRSMRVVLNSLLENEKYSDLKIISDLSHSESSCADKINRVLNFLIYFYDDKNLRDLRSFLTRAENPIIPLSRLLNRVLGTWTSHGVKRLADRGWAHIFEDALSRGQLESKLWLIENLRPFMKEGERVMIAAGWIGVLPALMFDRMGGKVSNILSIDLDASCEQMANQFNVKAQMDGGRFMAITGDVHDFAVSESQFDWVINSSCEHIENLSSWVKSLPKGIKIAVQSNNYFDHKEHVNCSSSLEEFESQVPLSKIFYKGELKLPKYNRYMIIGER